MSLIEIKQEHTSGKRISRPKINWLINQLEEVIGTTIKSRITPVSDSAQKDQKG